MNAKYWPEDDILQIRLSDKPITREIGQDWNTYLSFAEDGSLVEIVILDAKAHGLLPVTDSCHTPCEAREHYA
ncbi:MAG: DUF2283 domain-containing protein [Zoogloeaceae bacterium]|jgi:uncharacterized protein YuzE|nr:DUF2283 domain-containing protein [Zoogloeaceae bacterium]